MNKNKHIMTKDDIRDLAIRMVDKLVEGGYIPNCVDTDDDTEFEVQDILFKEIKKTLKKNKNV